MEGLLLEKKQVKAVMAPVDLNTAAITGARVAMAKGEKCAVVLSMGASVGATVQVTLKQHDAAVGGTSKVLAVKNPYFKKVNADTIFTKVEPTVAASLYDVSADFAANAGMLVLEVLAEDLDVNGGFTHFSVDIADSGAAKLGAGVYVLSEMKNVPAYNEVI